MGLKWRPNTVIAPQNRHAGTYASLNLESLAPTIQQAFDNALQVNGFPVLVFNQQHAGRKCTCSLKTSGDLSPASILDGNGNASPDVIESILQNASFGVRDYDSLATDNNPEQRSLPVTQVPGDKDYMFNRDNASNSELAPAPFGDLSTIAEEPGFEVNPLAAGAATYCGICLGSGFVPGYNLLGGKRVVLDATANPTLTSAILNQTSHPFSFVAANSNSKTGPAIISISWDVNFPNGIATILGLTALDNFTPVPAAFYLDGKTWDGSTLPLPGYHTITAAVNASKFTHVSFLYSSLPVSEYILADYPNWDKTNDLTIMDPLSEITIALSNRVPEIKVYDLIVDMVYQKLWRITNVSPKWDKFHNIYSWTLQARVVQQYEVFARLWAQTSQFRQVAAGEYLDANSAPE